MLKWGIRIVLISSAYLLVCAMGYLGYATYRSNLTGWFLILVAILYGCSGPFLLMSNLRKENVVRSETHDRSFWLVIPGFLVVFYASPLEYLLLPQTFPHASWTQIVGIALIAASLVLFGWARLALKSMYSGRIRVTADHTLVQHGPYQIIRHPAYASYIIMSLGIAIGFSSLIGLLAVPLLLGPGLVYRIIVEEQILSAEFGDQHNTYARSTKRLIPYIW